jgi:hypothetical protein
MAPTGSVASFETTPRVHTFVVTGRVSGPLFRHNNSAKWLAEGGMPLVCPPKRADKARHLLPRPQKRLGDRVGFACCTQ